MQNLSKILKYAHSESVQQKWNCQSLSAVLTFVSSCCVGWCYSTVWLIWTCYTGSSWIITHARSIYGTHIQISFNNVTPFNNTAAHGSTYKDHPLSANCQNVNCHWHGLLSCYATYIWNSLPDDTGSAALPSSYSWLLISLLFQQSFWDIIL